MANVMLLIVSILMFMGALWAGGLMIAQEDELVIGQEGEVLECLGAVENPVIISDHLYDVNDDLWAGYLEITGHDIWVGDEYEVGWHVPDDVQLTFMIRNRAPSRAEEVAVWVYTSPTKRGASWWFVFDTIVPDADGAIHPCGVYQVNREFWG